MKFPQFFGNRSNKGFEKQLKVKTPPQRDAKVPPPGRTSQVDMPSGLISLEENLKFILKDDFVKYIPMIRRSYPFVQNLSLAIQDMVQLTNTGHKVFFDNSLNAETVKKMRDELILAGKEWAIGGAGLDSLVNKFITQLYIGGAISAEWVPKEELNGIDMVAFIDPETIEISVNDRGKMAFHQQPRFRNSLSIDKTLISLNPLTYKYIGIGGDGDNPRGVPPLISALEDLGIQRDMMKNIRYIVKQLGILGFIELIMEKPVQNGKESDPAYELRLEKLLTQAKDNLMHGTSDGILVGYEGDHEYDFHSTTANITGLDSIYNLNQRMVANGLKYSGSFMGVSAGTDTNITIVFTKMLSQLKNIQLQVKAMLEFGYTLHLLLKGYPVKNLTVEFNPSTITDDLKMQQSEEIKIRNARTKYADGIISLEQYADELGYEKPDQKEPRAPIDPDGTIAREKADKEREKKKDDSDRRGRDKKAPQPPRKDQDTKTP